MFPLIQLPRKSEDTRDKHHPSSTSHVSINSTSEEVRRSLSDYANSISYSSFH